MRRAKCIRILVTLLPGPLSWSSKPTFETLVKFPTQSGETIGIPEEIEEKYRHFCIFLLNGECGDNIEDKGRGFDQILAEVFNHWVEGRGCQPVSWGTLVAVLRMIQLDDLARQIEDSLSKLV